MPKRHVWVVICENGAPAVRPDGPTDEPAAYFTKADAVAARPQTCCSDRAKTCRGRPHHRVVRYVDGLAESGRP